MSEQTFAVALGSDHVGYPLKEKIKAHLLELGYFVKDFGTCNEERCDYPLYAEAVGKAVASGEYGRGILVCGTGVGISVAANKIHGVRAVCCSEPYSALLSRQHNDSNILAMGARVVGDGLAFMIIDAWLLGKYEGGRHQKRLDQIAHLEETQSENPDFFL